MITGKMVTMNDNYSGVMDVPKRHQFNLLKLANFLAEKLHIDPTDLRIRQFKGGQSNPTFLLEVARQRLVLRKKPHGNLLPSAHAVEREYRVMSALRDTPVPVARVIGLCEDAGVIGTPFFIMEYVEGRIFWDPALPGLTPEHRTAIYADMARVLADLHRQCPQMLGLDDFGRAGNYFVRQIDRWTRQYRAAETEPIEAMDALIEWLPVHIPDDASTSLVHADFRLDNLIYHPSEPRVLAVLDWELSTIGHPLADLASHCAAWHMPPTYRGLDGQPLQALGIPDEAAHIAHYSRAMGLQGIEHWNFYMAFAMFRKAAIIQGVVKRRLMGNASSEAALGIDRVRFMSMCGVNFAGI